MIQRGRTAGCTNVQWRAGERWSGVPHARRARYTWTSIVDPQWLQASVAVFDIRTIVECSPQFGHTDRNS